MSYTYDVIIIEVMEWMLDIQLGRRNLSPIQRIAIAEKYRNIYEAQAQIRLEEGRRKGGKSSPNNSTPKMVDTCEDKKRSENETNAKLAKIANVGKETYRQAKRILDSNNEDLKQRVKSGETAGVGTGTVARYDAVMKSDDDEDEILQDLLETNIRQRGDVGGSAKKVGLRIKEIERIYGIRDGSNNPHGINVGEKNSFTQSDIAQKLGFDVRTLQNYKLLADMIPD